jgi:hypothetical protein
MNRRGFLQLLSSGVMARVVTSLLPAIPSVIITPTYEVSKAWLDEMSRQYGRSMIHSFSCELFDNDTEGVITHAGR